MYQARQPQLLLEATIHFANATAAPKKMYVKHAPTVIY